MHRTTSFLLAVCLTSGALRADGPHWYVPEPPEYDSQLLDKDEPTIKRYTEAMALARGGDDLHLDIVSVCIRYLREYEDYVAAPDSPKPWHSREGREQMARYAVATLRILSERPELCQRVVDAFADQIRFRDDIRNARLAPALKEFVDLNARLNKVLQAWSEVDERCLELKEQIKRLDKNETDKRAALKADLDKAEVKLKALKEEWTDLSKQGLPALLQKCQKDLPRSFVRNMTGDIPFLQDDSTDRFREALKQIGMPAVPPLQKLLRHSNPAVVAEAAGLLKAIGERLRTPEKAVLTKTVVAREVSALREIRAPRAMAALQNLRSYGDRVLPFLVEIAKDEDLKLRREALGALYSLTGQLFGDRVEEWEQYVERRLGRAGKNGDAPKDAAPPDNGAKE